MEKLEQYIYDNNIYLFKTEYDFVTALYSKYKGIDCIGVDYSKIKSNTEKYCVLAHEVAHFKTGTVYNCFNAPSDVSRAEFRANKRMINDIIPFDNLISFIKRNKPEYICEVAEEFGVTEDIIDKALKLYTII